jgi:hypothetical protein
MLQAILHITEQEGRNGDHIKIDVRAVLLAIQCTILVNGSDHGWVPWLFDIHDFQAESAIAEV